MKDCQKCQTFDSWCKVNVYQYQYYPRLWSIEIVPRKIGRRRKTTTRFQHRDDHASCKANNEMESIRLRWYLLQSATWNSDGHPSSSYLGEWYIFVGMKSTDLFMKRFVDDIYIIVLLGDKNGMSEEGWQNSNTTSMVLETSCSSRRTEHLRRRKSRRPSRSSSDWCWLTQVKVCWLRPKRISLPVMSQTRMESTPTLSRWTRTTEPTNWKRRNRSLSWSNSKMHTASRMPCLCARSTRATTTRKNLRVA